MRQTLADTIRAANTALIEEWRIDDVAEYFASDYVAHLTNQDLSGGHDAVRRFLRRLQSAFSKLAVEVEILVEADDRIAWQRRLTGTQTGAYSGFPASGREIVWRDVLTSRVREGLIVEEWVISDLAEQLLRARKR